MRHRIQHIGNTVLEIERRKRQNYERAKQGVVGMSASFFVFEIGQRIQDQRDLNAGVGDKAFQAWSYQPGALVITRGDDDVQWNAAVDQCAATLSAVSAKTDACMQAWINADRATSLELVIATVVVSVFIMFMNFWRTT